MTSSSFAYERAPFIVDILYRLSRDVFVIDDVTAIFNDVFRSFIMIIIPEKCLHVETMLQRCNQSEIPVNYSY